MAVRRLTALLLLTVLLAGCTSTIDGRPRAAAPAPDPQRQLVADYFARNNAAARSGSEQQERFFAATQHPDYRGAGQACGLDGLTVELDPSLTTLRPAPQWRPGNVGPPPRGTVYVVAVRVTVQRSGALLGEQIGSVHVALLDGRVVGFAPCPS